MTKNCGTCLFKEGSCYPSKTIFDKDKTCKSYEPDYEGYIAELEAQIEKMKGCENCKYKYIQDSCDLGEGTRTDPCLSCRSNNMWEFDNE